MSPLAAHARRLLAWGGLSAGLGLALIFLVPGWWAVFGGMTASWGAINAIIGWSVRKGHEESRRKTREFLALNLGLNAGYIGFGVAMIWLGHGTIQASGWAIVFQGFGLMVLDLWLWLKIPPRQA